MIIFLYGPDTYRSKQKIEELKEKFIQEVDKSKLNIIKLEGKDLSQSKFRETVLAPGFLARRRMIIIENICNSQLQKQVISFLEKKEKDKLKSSGLSRDHEKLQNQKNNKKDNIIIFWEDGAKYKKDAKIQKSNGLFNKLKQQKYAQEFTLLKGYKLNEWIKTEVIKRDGKIENQAINQLAESVGSNLWQMSNEIDKLIAYKQNKIITSDDINLLVKSKIDENVFNLVDALGTKNKKLALKLLNNQLDTRTPWPYLMAMIIRQFRILLQIKSSSSAIPGLHAFVLQKARVQAKNYSLEELKNIYQQLLKIDVRLKTSQIDPGVLFDLFIVKQ